jgi:hypothetical protein
MTQLNPLYWAEYGARRYGNKLRQRQRMDALEEAGIRHNFYPRLGLVFVHVPKAAGTTLHEYFSKLDDASERVSPHHDAIERLRRDSVGSKHLKAADYRRTIGAEAWDKIYSFAVVRNPWDIMVSSYHWWLDRGPGFNSHLKGALRVRHMSSFEEFLDSDLGMGAHNEQLVPLESWFQLDGRDIVTRVGKFESLQEDLAALCKDLGQESSDITISHRNKGNRSSYQQYYTPRSREKVFNKFRYIVERFNYEF